MQYAYDVHVDRCVDTWLRVMRVVQPTAGEARMHTCALSCYSL